MVILQEVTVSGDDGEIAPRGYQLEFLRKAIKENVIVCLETGCGKTLIAVLLLKATLKHFKASTPFVSVFLVPTVMLVEQQANAIKQQSTLKVGQYNSKSDAGKWDVEKWKTDINDQEVLVMTPQVLLNMLRHAFIKMEAIKVLIFDECHHCQKGHPYARIMEEFYFKSKESDRPKILGMTASPVIRKGRSQHHCSQDINSLELMLDAKIISVEARGELEKYVPSPNIEIKEYGKIYHSINDLKSFMDSLRDLMIKAGALESSNLNKKEAHSFEKIFRDIDYCIYELGVWFGKHAVEHVFCADLEDPIAAEICITDSQVMRKQLLKDISQCIKQRFGCFGDIDLSAVSLKPDMFSMKVKTLVDVLLESRDPKLKCIVFVERVVAAKVIAVFLSRIFKSMRCTHIVGKHSRAAHASRKCISQTLDEFKSGMIDLIVATNVAEEGLDIQKCNLVIQFDMPKTLRSFIQARGRARVRASRYIILKDRMNFSEENLLQNLFESEEFLMDRILNGTECSMVSERDLLDMEAIYQVETTGATVTLNSSVALLHHFCSKLPADQFYSPQPQFIYMDHPDGIQCSVLLPSNAPMREVMGEPSESKVGAKQLACLKACRVLHSKGLLTDNLLPQPATIPEVSGVHPFNQRSLYLHEGVVPAVWSRETLSRSNTICLHGYMLSFSADFQDRDYIKLGLLFPSALPQEVTDLKLPLQLHHRKKVLCRFERLNNFILDESQVACAEAFQLTLFSILIDRNLDRSNLNQLQSPDRCWYLIVPLIEKGSGQNLDIDWDKIIKLSPSSNLKQCSSGECLQFATETVSVKDIPGLLIKTTWGKDIYCTIDTFKDVYAHSPFPDPGYESYADYFKTKYSYEIQHTEQPLLKARFLRDAHNLLQLKSIETDCSVATKSSSEIDRSIVELPPEICHVLFYGVYDALVNSSLAVPTFMHKLESMLLAVELRNTLSSQFSEGSHVSVEKVLEALTTQKCLEPFSLERLELLGDSFLKYAVTSHLFLNHEEADEGILSMKRIKQICNSSLFELGKAHGLHGFIRDELFQAKNWVSPCHPSVHICDESKLLDLHGKSNNQDEGSEAKICNKRHRWIKKKTVADVVEAMIGAYLESGGEHAALAFMSFIGVRVSKDDSLQITKIQKSSENSCPSLYSRIDIESLEKMLSYTFRFKGLIIEAFTHASATGHLGRCYQRLEFLGDSVLDYLITRYLYKKYEQSNPGELTDLRSSIVCNESFARITVQNKLYKHLIHNSEELSKCVSEFVKHISTDCKAEELGDWDGNKCPKVLGDIFESLAGAVFVDGGFDLDLVWRVFSPMLEEVISCQKSRIHPVRELQELCQKNKLNLEKRFSFEAYFQCEFIVENYDKNHSIIRGCASAKDKMSAKRQAALDLLMKLKDLGYVHPKRKEAQTIKSNLVSNEETEFDISKGLCDLMEYKKTVTKEDIELDISKTLTESSPLDMTHYEASAETFKKSDLKNTASIIDIHQTEERDTLHCLPLQVTDVSEHKQDVKLQLSSFNLVNDIRLPVCDDGSFSVDPVSFDFADINQRINGATTFNRTAAPLDMFSTLRNHLPSDEQNICRMSSGAGCSGQIPSPALQQENKIFGTMKGSNRLDLPGQSTLTAMTGLISLVSGYNAGEARAQLYEVCDKKKLKRPTYSLRSEEGPAHSKTFTYLVTIELPGVGYVECTGDPTKSKSAAMDSAAAELLTWLRSEGHA